MTQEDLARALGIAREVVMRALHELQQAEAIWCGYGRILIRKRPMLESTACECYRPRLFLTYASSSSSRGPQEPSARVVNPQATS
jgi:hypothetical protein